MEIKQKNKNGIVNNLFILSVTNIYCTSTWPLNQTLLGKFVSKNLLFSIITNILKVVLPYFPSLYPCYMLGSQRTIIAFRCIKATDTEGPGDMSLFYPFFYNVTSGKQKLGNVNLLYRHLGKYNLKTKLLSTQKTSPQGLERKKIILSLNKH